MAEPIRAEIGLAPVDTVSAIAARSDLTTTVGWTEFWHEDHARSFTVAKIAKLDLLAEVHRSLEDAARNGATLEQWQAGLEPRLRQAGWWGLVRDEALTGSSDPVFVGPRRLRTIYQTNMRVSRAAGQWRRIQAMKEERPYLRYSAVMDSRTRPAHRAWHGTILPVDHSWWETHFPPCGWNCRCTVQQLAERDLKRMGWSVSTPPPEGPARPWYRSGSDRPEFVPAGIDPGWAYNPGKALLASIGEKAARSVDEAVSAGAVAAARATVREIVESEAFERFMDEPTASLPVMVLDDTLAGAVAADTRVAVLSAESYRKQVANHAELTIADYRRLPDVGADPDLVLRQDDQRLILLKLGEDRWLKVTVKATADRSELFVVSVQYAREREIARLRRKFEVLLDR